MKAEGKYIKSGDYVKIILDVNLLFNYLWSMPSMKQGETWTPICVPGCTEDFMLHVYTNFKQFNLGIVLVCTDHATQCFDEC